MQRSGWSVLGRASPSLLVHPSTPGGLSLFSWATAGSRTFHSRFPPSQVLKESWEEAPSISPDITVSTAMESPESLCPQSLFPTLDFFTTRPCLGSCGASLLPLKLYPQQWPSTAVSTSPVTSLTISSVACCLLPGEFLGHTGKGWHL